MPFKKKKKLGPFGVSVLLYGSSLSLAGLSESQSNVYFINTGMLEFQSHSLVCHFIFLLEITLVDILNGYVYFCKAAVIDRAESTPLQPIRVRVSIGDVPRVPVIEGADL